MTQPSKRKRIGHAIKCPVCGGPPNRLWLSKAKIKYAEFIVQCWSGDTNKTDAPHHFFKATVRLAQHHTYSLEENVSIPKIEVSY